MCSILPSGAALNPGYRAVSGVWRAERFRRKGNMLAVNDLPAQCGASCKRPPFGLRKVAFWRMKGGLWESERLPFGKAGETCPAGAGLRTWSGRAHKIWKDTLKLRDNAARRWRNSSICAKFAANINLIIFGFLNEQRD